MGPMGGLPKAPRRSNFKLGTNFQSSYNHNDMVDNCIVIKFTFDGIFVPKNVIIRTLLGLIGPEIIGPANTYGCIVTRS